MSKIIIEFEIEKQVNLQDGDILIVTLEKQEDLESIGKVLAQMHPNKNIMLISSDAISDIEIANPEVMKRYGWKRIEGFTKRD